MDKILLKSRLRELIRGYNTLNQLILYSFADNETDFKMDKIFKIYNIVLSGLIILLIKESRNRVQKLLIL